MAMIGHPLLLDDVYGQKKANRSFSKRLKLRRFLLHASRIEFPHPVTGESVIITAPLPMTFGAALKKLRM
jgi:23S rRNA-/tRNA-specific pseudouridylate synthase